MHEPVRVGDSNLDKKVHVLDFLHGYLHRLWLDGGIRGLVGLGVSEGGLVVPLFNRGVIVAGPVAAEFADEDEVFEGSESEQGEKNSKGVVEDVGAEVPVAGAGGHFGGEVEGDHDVDEMG